MESSSVSSHPPPSWTFQVGGTCSTSDHDWCSALKCGVDRGMLEEIWDVLSESFGMGSGYTDYEDDEYLIETD